MFSRRTVFVLGAGASCDLGLPSGDQLREKLLRTLRRDGDNFRFSNEHLHRAIIWQSEQRGGSGGWTSIFQEYLDAASRIRAGLPLAISIDNYLDAHRDDQTIRELGKLAIATAILDAERSSALNNGSVGSVAGINRFKTNPKLEQSWYLPLMRLLTSGKSVDEVQTMFANVAFVVFNYDRCLEQFLVNAVMSYFNVAPEIAVQCLQQLRVVHPYGRVGYLPWQRQPITAAFGDLGSDLNLIAQGIQTFTESSDEGIVSEVRDIITGAETLVIMGYGFLQQNNDLLSVEASGVKRVFCTTMDISDSDVPIIKREICKIISKEEPEPVPILRSNRYARIFVERADCKSLMNNHRFRLSREPDPI